MEGDRILSALQRNQDLLRGRADNSRAALAGGLSTLAIAAPGITALQLARSAALDQEHAQLMRVTSLMRFYRYLEA